MVLNNLYLQEALLVFLFLVYNYSIFEMGDTFLENPRLKKVLRIPVGLLNTVLAVGFTLLPNFSSRTSYICIGLLLFIEFLLFYKEKILRIIALVLSYLVHIMVVRSLCISVFSIATEISIYRLSNESLWLVVTMNVTFIVVNIMLFAVIKLLSTQNASIITEHKEQLIFLFSFTGICCLYFFFNAGIYSNDLPYDAFSAQNQLAVSVTILCGYYLVLIFSIMVGRSVYYKQKNAELKDVAERDSLTGLYNKGATEKYISAFIARNIEPSPKGALFIIDVDNFKTVNDRLGHAFGDLVLCELSGKLKTIFRSSASNVGQDISGDIIGRIGGDEFMVFMKNTTDTVMLTNKANSILQAFRNSYQDGNQEVVMIAGSVGIAACPENGGSFEDLYRCADIALYLSKNKGKDTYSFYSGEEFKGYQSHRDIIE